MNKNRKAMIFTTDALLSISLLLIVGAIVLSQSTVKPANNYIFQQSQSLAEDAMRMISAISFGEVEESLKSEIIASTNITESDEQMSISYVIGELWAENTTTSMYYAENLTKKYMGQVIPKGYNYSLSIDNETIYTQQKTNYSVLSASRRMISGIHEGKPSKGVSTRISISNILSKDTARYIYFGGFVGEGNITKTLELPEVIENVTEVYMELDTVYNYTIYVNEKFSGTYNTTNPTEMIPSNWTMDNQYHNYFEPGNNTILINFTGTSSGYIGGGFIKVSYNTSQMDTSLIDLDDDKASERYYFSGIEGFINIYSSFYVPGDLESMSIHLHLDNPYNTYLYIGDRKLYDNSTNNTEYVDFDDTELSTKLDYTSLSHSTNPLRIGIDNMTGLSEGSDVVLITDLSTSMETFDVLPGNLERMAVAKDSDKEFIDTILDNEGQKVGLIAYGTTTADARTIYLTDDNTTLKDTIDDYDHTEGWTCISCGIYDSKEILKTTTTITTLIDNGAATSWRYNDTYHSSEPPADPEGDNWYDIDYSYHNEWLEGNAPLGNGPTSIPLGTTINTYASSGETSYPDLWDDNITTMTVSFETGYNSTANTYGWDQGNDGWDRDPHDNSGPYDYDDEIIYRDDENGRLELETGSGNYNNCYWGSFLNRFCSGSYGIEFTITQKDLDIIDNNGNATLSFWYEWDGNGNYFEPADQVWIKSRITNSSGTPHWLGRELDTSHTGNDLTEEVDTRDNPNDDFSGAAVLDITPYITSTGTYYLDFGGKLKATEWREYGTFRFDDILIEIKNGTSTYYFRKSFTIADINTVGRGFLKVASDDLADIYLNGRLIDADPGPSHEAEHWNRIEFIDRKYFQEGENIIAARLTDNQLPTLFDLRLEVFNSSRNRAMLVMSDGAANYILSGAFSPATAKQEAIDFACSAYENYGIISHAVGFGTAADEETMAAIAECGRGMYYTSNNVNELRKIYADIADAMVSYNTQRSDIIGAYTTTTLYPDSYIEYNYTPSADLEYGDISLTFSSDTFGDTSGDSAVESPKEGTYWIPPTVEVIDAKATSYSSEYWTSYLNMRSETSSWTNAFNLSSYQREFSRLGDPFIVYMPPSLIGKNQTNYVELDTGINETYFTGGSPTSRVIYTLKIKGSASYSEVSSKAEGCTWTVEQYNRINTTIRIPTTYTGSKTCRFSSNETTYDTDDSVDNAAHTLFMQLDPTGDNRIDIAIDQADLEIRIIKVQDIPWMWGPAIMKLEIWR